jgi:hypothetical protein
MSKHETRMTRKYWESIGGLLIEEFVAVKGNKNQGRRSLDGVVVLGEPTSIHNGNFFDVKNKDIVVIQTKPGRLNMSLLGQTLFSGELMERYNPKSIKLVSVCGKSDGVLSICASEKNIQVIVINK